MDNFEAAEIQPVDMSMQVVKEVGAKLLVDMAEFIGENPQFVVNGFIKSGITGALDQIADNDEEDTSLEDDTSDYDSFTDTNSNGDSDKFDA